MFKFDNKQLADSLDKWVASQREKQPKLLDMHADYMRASILAFLYSKEVEHLREE